MRSICTAVAKSTGTACRKRALPGSRYCLFHVDRGPLLLAGILGAVLSLIVSEVYRAIVPSAESQHLVSARQETAELKKAFTERETHLQAKVDQLLDGSHTLQERLQPFEDLARKLHPGVEQQAALERLQQDFERLRAIAAKYEFAPLNEQLRASILTKLKAARGGLGNRPYSVLVSYEPWVAPPTRQLADEVAGLLRNAGFQVQGPEFATVYLVGPSYPVEWGFNERDTQTVDRLFEAFSTLIRPEAKHAVRRSFPEGQARIHFAGRPIFAAGGSVSIE